MRTLLVGLILLWCIPSLALTITTMESRRCFFSFKIEGEITHADIAKFRDLAASIREHDARRRCGGEVLVHFKILSNGGDIAASLEIGRIIRGIERVRAEAFNCASACVFLFAGAVKRYVWNYGTAKGIGLHRFYFGASVDGSIADLRNKRAVIRKEIENYLDEMDVSRRVLDISEGIPPHQVRWLSTEEAQELRLEGTDAGYDEREVRKEAKKIGLTPAEYRRRKARADQLCVEPFRRGLVKSPVFGCEEPVIMGMTHSEIARARELWWKKCEPFIGPDPKPGDERAEDLWMERFRACENANPIRANPSP